MARQTCYTVVTPLPAGITRQTVLEYLHSHLLMIDLNPLVEERHQIPKGPPRASAEEFSYATWYSLTDRISYLPGGLYTGRVSYHVCFHDLPDGLQTHCYAPLGLDIKERWTVGGHEPGELKKNLELGIGAPKEGLFLREDVDMRCSTFVTAFVKKNLKRAHGVLVDRLVEMAAKRERDDYNERLMRVGSSADRSGRSIPAADEISSRSTGSIAEQRRTPTLVSDASVSSNTAPSTPIGVPSIHRLSDSLAVPGVRDPVDVRRNSSWTVSTMHSPVLAPTTTTYPFSPAEITGYGGTPHRVTWTPPASPKHFRQVSGGPPLGDLKGEAVVREWNGPSELQERREMPAELPA